MEESAANKEKILQGATELFLKYGVRSVSMDDIARHLAISKKTIYQYFADKDDVVNMVAVEHMERMKADFEAIRITSRNSIDELVHISRQLKRELEGINPSMLFDLHKYHPKAWNSWVDHKNNYIRGTVVQNLVQGIEEGYFRPELNADIIARLRIEQVQIAFDPKVYPQDAFNMVEVQIQIFEHFTYGLLTDKGRKLYEKYRLEIKELEHTTTPKHN